MPKISFEWLHFDREVEAARAFRNERLGRYRGLFGFKNYDWMTSYRKSAMNPDYQGS
jgi:hypothetical protein